MVAVWCDIMLNEAVVCGWWSRRPNDFEPNPHGDGGGCKLRRRTQRRGAMDELHRRDELICEISFVGAGWAQTAKLVKERLVKFCFCNQANGVRDTVRILMLKKFMCMMQNYDLEGFVITSCEYLIFTAPLTCTGVADGCTEFEENFHSSHPLGE